MISERQFVRSFESYWTELLPLLTPTYIALFNEASFSKIVDPAGKAYEPLELPRAIQHPDIVAELAFRLACAVHAEGADLAAVRTESTIVDSAERVAVELVKRYEGVRPAIALPLSTLERGEAVRLAQRYSALYRLFSSGATIQYCPRFPGAGFLDTCEGDLAIDNTLVEVKTTTRRPSSRDIRQLLIYMALDSHAGLNRWSQVAIFNPRRGDIYKIDADILVSRITGGRSRTEVFSDLMEFLELTDPLVEPRF